jgi:hypothetical protein
MQSGAHRGRDFLRIRQCATTTLARLGHLPEHGMPTSEYGMGPTLETSAQLVGSYLAITFRKNLSHCSPSSWWNANILIMNLSHWEGRAAVFVSFSLDIYFFMLMYLLGTTNTDGGHWLWCLPAWDATRGSETARMVLCGFCR